MKKYLKLRKLVTRIEETPLILDDTNLLLTKKKYSSYIQEAIFKLSPEYRDIFVDLKNHSLRAGVPTALQKLGDDVDPEVMQYLGRWKGKSVNLYLKDATAAASARLTIAKAINDNVI